MPLRKRSEPNPAGRTLDSNALSPARILALAVAGISPSAALFTTFGDGLSLSGTGWIWAFIVGSVIAIAMALCFAEAGAAHPSAGGSFALIHESLGPFFGGIASILFVVLNLFFLAFVCDAMATFIGTLTPGGVPVGPIGFGMVVLVTLLTLGRVSPASWLATAMLMLELTVILTFTGFAFAHPSLHADPFLHPQMLSGPHTVVTFGVAALFAGAAPALLALNGYDAPLYLVEETERKRTAPRGVLVAVAITIVIELTAVIAATYALPHNFFGVQTSSSPLSVIADSTMGHTGSTILTYSVIVAIFDSTLVGYIVICRVIFDAARKSLWPGGATNRFLAYIGPTQVPVGACAVMFVGVGVLTLWSSFTTLITFTTVILTVIYAMVAAAAIATRLRARGAATQGFRMPLWPVPPLIAIAGAALVLKYQTAHDLLITGAIILVAAAFHGWRLVQSRRAEPAVAQVGTAEIPSYDE